jgi:uncharacterized protein (UPF0335 family)
MSSLDFDLGTQMNRLEHEWRQVYSDSIDARAEYQSLAATKGTNADQLDLLRERLDRAEAKKARIMAKIELLEGGMSGED